MISIAAFAVSIVTGLISAYRTHQQDINSRRDALHLIIQQFYALQISSVQAQFEFWKDTKDPTNQVMSDDPHSKNASNATTAFNNAIVNQNAVLFKQGYSLLRDLNHNATSIDYSQVAILAMFGGQPAVAEKLYSESARVAEDTFEYTGAMRGLAGLQHNLGEYQDSKISIGLAMSAFDKFPNEPKESTNFYVTQAETMLFWVNVIGISDCHSAKDSLATAETYISKFPPGAYPDQQKAKDLEFALRDCK